MQQSTVEVAPPLPTREGLFSAALSRWQALTLLLLIAWLYSAILARLVLQWVGPHSDPNFQHGIFVPFFAAFVLWQDRKRLQSIAPSPSWSGLVYIAISMVMLALGVLGADIFLPRVSLLILLAGLVIVFLGWKFFRAVLFPWLVLFLMIPLPALIINRVTFPLQLLASKLASALLELVGVPVLRQGNLIKLVDMQLDVAEACSGIRSLLTLITLAIIYGYLMETRKWVRVVLAVSAVPIAVAANSLRVFGTGLLVQFWDPDKAVGFFHTFEGWLIFVVALIMFFALHRLICLIWGPSPAPPLYAADLAPALAPARPEARGAVETVALRERSRRFVIVSAVILVAAIGLQARSSTEIIPVPPPLSALPATIDGWTGTDQTIPEETLDILGHPKYLFRDYENASEPQPSINLYVVYFPSQRAGDTIHSPNHCLPGAGWIPISREMIQLAFPNGSSIPVNRYVVTNLGDRQLVLYWFQAHGRVVASEWQAKYYLIDDAIKMNRSDGGMVRLMTPMFKDESAEAAQARMMTLGSKLLPLLDNYIPR